MGDELGDIRARRMAQLQEENNRQAMTGGSSMQEKAAAEEERRIAANEMKNSMLSQILSQEARARLNTLMIGKPEKGKMVENLILQMAQQRQIMTKLTDKELIGILESVNEQFDSKRKTTVKFDRRRVDFDSDDEL